MKEFNAKPFFFVIGAQKSGTTTIHKLLSNSHEVSLPDIKETHFFSNENNFKRGLEYYTNNFDLSKAVMCEVDPSYIFFGEVPSRIKKIIDNPKIIILLRKPIERALSHYYMSYYRGYETLSFIDALDNEADRLKNDKDNFSFINHSYLKRGEYYNQIKRYSNFFEKDDFLFINFNDLILQDTKNCIKSICRFMNIDDRLSEVELPHSNNKKKVKSEIVRDLLYRDSFFKKTAKLLVPSDYIINRFKKIVNYFNSRDYQKSELKDDINLKLGFLPDVYIKWNNTQTRLMEKYLDVDLKDWYI